MAVSLSDLDPDAQDFIQDALWVELLREREPRVLCLLEDAKEAETVRAKLAMIGCDVEVVTTELEAVEALYSCTQPVSTLVIDAGCRAFAGIDFARLAATLFPKVRRVLSDGPEKFDAAAGAVLCGLADTSRTTPRPAFTMRFGVRPGGETELSDARPGLRSTIAELQTGAKASLGS